MRIVFQVWSAGFHGIAPNPIPISSMKQAQAILKAIAAATGPSDGIYAKVIGRQGRETYWHIWDEELNEVDQEDYDCNVAERRGND